MTKAQLQKFSEFNNDRSDEIVEHTLEMIDELSPAAKNRLLQKLKK